MHKKLIRLFGRFNKRPDHLPIDHTNYNFEQYREYTKRYKKALEQKELILKKIDTNVPAKKKSQIIKDTNYSIENYQAWRIFDTEELNFGKECGLYAYPHGKIVSTPNLLIKTFGHFTRAPSVFPRATACLKFEDRNLDIFYIYDARKDLEKLRESKLELEIAKEYWNNDEIHEFWFTGSSYAEKHRFKRFIKKQLEDCAEGRIPTFEEQVKKHTGGIELYDNYDKEYELRKVPLIYRHHRSEFEKIAKTKLDYIEDAVYDGPLEKPEILKNLEGLEKF